MSTMELRSILLREVSNIIEDDTLMEKAVNYLRSLRQDASEENTHVYTVDELKERAREGLNQEKEGLGISGTEMFKRIEAKRPWLRK